MKRNVQGLREAGLFNLLGLSLATMSVACGGGPRDETEPSGSADAGMSAGQDDDDDDDGDDDDDDDDAEETGDDDDDDDNGTKLDVGPDPGMEDAGDAGGEMGCDKVDFLFVIDNSGSMGDEQNSLINSFPGFIDTISSTLDDAQDYHIMVTDVDAYVYEQCVSSCDAEECLDEAGICNPLAGPACLLPCTIGTACALDGGFQCGVTEPMECEDVLGAGITFPRGSQASNQDCMFDSGARYMTDQEPDLAGAFDCAARVGTGSWAATERPMESMVAAVTDSSDAADCNEGFLRDDAILVVTFITDEDDGVGDSAGTPAGWKQALVAAKNGDESAVVVLGLFGDNDLPGSICPELTEDSTTGAEPAPRLREFVDSFGDHGFFGSVCAANYDDFFSEAVALIDTTCEEFIPPEG